MSDKDLPVNMNRDFKGIWIPREIWLAEGLAPTEKILWAEINSLHNREKGGCYASNDYLCQFMGVKERRLQEMISNLKAYGLVVQVSFDGRERIIKAICPPDGFIACRAEVQNNAPLGCGKMHLSDAPDCTPPIYIENIDEGIDNNTPPNPPISANAEVASAPMGVLDSPKKKRERAPSAFSCKVKEVADKMINILVTCNPVYRPPENLEKFLQAVEVMIEKDEQKPEDILQAFEWACSDNEQRDSFKGWQSVVCTNKRKGKISNPAEIFRGHFSTIYSQMNSRQKRKFAPSSKGNFENSELYQQWNAEAL